jgi:hypothetical protein
MVVRAPWAMPKNVVLAVNVFFTIVGSWGCGVVGLWGCGVVGLWGCGVVGLWVLRGMSLIYKKNNGFTRNVVDLQGEQCFYEECR